MSRKSLKGNNIVDLEAYVLGSMLRDYEFCQEALRKVSGSCFSSPTHKDILKGIRDLRNLGKRPNVSDVWSRLTAHGEDPVLIGSYLHKITSVKLDAEVFISSLGWLEVQGICKS